MIPALGLMVGSYIVLRCIEAITKEDSVAIQLAAFLVGIIALGCTFQIVRLGVKATGALNGLGL